MQHCIYTEDDLYVRLICTYVNFQRRSETHARIVCMYCPVRLYTTQDTYCSYLPLVYTATSIEYIVFLYIKRIKLNDNRAIYHLKGK
jgi:hypothetical protein